jgi:RNA polymerase sigma-70 factor (ECF subfamily)
VTPGEGVSAEQDGILIRQARNGDAAAFDQIVARHTPRLYQSIRRFASDRSEAEVVVQETWLRAWRALPRCDPDRPLFPWLARIAMNVTRDLWRRRRPLDFADVGDEVEAQPAGDPGPEQALDRSLALERLALGVQRLRPEHRAVIALRYDGNLTYEEIAQALGIEVNTVRTHLHRAKMALRRRMEAENG